MRKILLTTAASGALLLGVPAIAGGPTGTSATATSPPPAATHPAPAAQQYQHAEPDPLWSYRWHRESVLASGTDPRAVTSTPEQHAEMPGTYPRAAAPAVGYHTGERLMHEQVLDANGAELGLITDLLVGPDNRIHHIVVETPVAPYETFVLPSERIYLEEGAAEPFFVDMTREQLAALPQYQIGPGGPSGSSPALRPEQ